MAYIKEIVNKKGVSYQVNIRAAGYKPVYKTFKGDKAKTRAKKWASIVEGQMNDGIYKEMPDILNIQERDQIDTIETLIAYFRKNVAPERYASPEKYNAMFDWWISHIGSIKIHNLSSSIISGYKEILRTEPIKKGKKKIATRSNNTVNKYLMCLSAILTYAVKELEIIEVNPCSNVATLPKSKGRERFLTLDEIELFLGACKEHSQMVYIFALISISTGARYSEVLHLKVENIDYQNSQIHYLNTKNKENRGVPIEPDILRLLKCYLVENKIESGNIFRAKRNDGEYPYIKGILEKIIKDTNIKNFHIHDIRHTTASYIAMNGGSLLDIAEILGHKSLVMARRYSHLTKKHTATVLNNVTTKILPEI